YKNVVAFLIGNEVTNDVDTTKASAFVKAALRDVKSYIKKSNLEIPVGYADNDDEEVRNDLIKYFNCGQDPLARVDFYGVNTYRWCGPNVSYKTSGYEQMAQPFKEYSIPVIMTEYGCNKVRPRSFNEVKSIYGKDLNDIFSGGFVYEYSQEDNDYGVVKIVNGNSFKKMSDYENLKDAYSSSVVNTTNTKRYTVEKRSFSECPKTSKTWRSGSKLPPTPNSSICSCMMNSLKCSLDPDSVLLDKNPPDSQMSERMMDPAKEKVMGSIIDDICGKIDCKGIEYDTVSGVYGEFSFCSEIERAAWAINENFMLLKQSQKACTFNGIVTNVVKSPKEDISSCLSKPGNNDISKIENIAESKKEPSSASSLKVNSTKHNYFHGSLDLSLQSIMVCILMANLIVFCDFCEYVGDFVSSVFLELIV
ncbi:hypothetical protein BB559_004085, partial [Furculomyces boomerangus]